MILQIPKATASAATMVEPTGVPARIEIRIPARALTEIMAIAASPFIMAF